MASNHGSSTQLYIPPPWCCHHHYPTTRLSSSQTDVLKGKGRKDFNQDHILPSWKAFRMVLQGEVIRKHREANPSAPSTKPCLAINQGLNSLLQRGHVPPLLLPQAACPLYVTTDIPVTARQRKGISNQSEEEGTPPFSRLSHSTAGRRGTLIHLKRKHVPGVFTSSTS